MEKKPVIFKYLDYRKFLKDYYNYMKATTPGFSYRYFARVAQISTQSYLKMVIDGQRNLTKTFVGKVAKTCGLSCEEREYFFTLVEFNQAANLKDRNRYLKKLSKLSSVGTQKRISDEQYRLLSKWYYPVIRTLVSLPGFIPDPAGISRRLGGLISVRQAREALDVLLEIGVIKREGDRYVPVDRHLATEDEVLNTAIQNFHTQMIPVGAHVFDMGDVEDRELRAATFSIPFEKFPEVKLRIKQFYKELIKYVSGVPGTPEEICQMNFQFFRYIDRKGEGGK